LAEKIAKIFLALVSRIGFAVDPVFLDQGIMIRADPNASPFQG